MNGMVDVIHLRPTELPPKERNYLIVECVSDSGATSGLLGDITPTLAVTLDGLDSAISNLRLRAEREGYDAVYVVGDPHA
jgi:hypothetical protein